MDDKKEGLSLRNKGKKGPRPDGRGPVPNGGSLPGRPKPRPKNSQASLPPGQADKTADLVKRRYSTRFNQIPQDFNAALPPLPGVPSLPSQFADKAPPSRDGRGGPVDAQKVAVEIRALRDPNLQSEKYVAGLLADASEEDIRTYQRDLKKLQSRTATDMQNNVYQNRTQFIKISKDAEKLKDEMRSLRNLMSEVTGILGQATADDNSADDRRARNRANRSSVANLAALWSSHLQELWRRVEGSQRFLPAVPGRHIVYESMKWRELNAATFKPRRRIAMVLLNDNLLVASEKKSAAAGNDPRNKRAQNAEGYVADRCWPLQDIELIDVASRPDAGVQTGNAANAITLRVGGESITYAPSSSLPGEKETFLTNYRQAAEEIRKKMASENEDREKARESLNYYAIRNSGLMSKSEVDHLAADVARAEHSASSMLIDVDGKQQNIRWVEGQIDTLDIDIAMQHFEEAVEKVEKLKRLAKNIKGNQFAQEMVNRKVTDRAAKLASALERQMMATSGQQGPTQQFVQWLMRLGFEDSARQAYLSARSAVVDKRAKQCVFEGDLHHYTYQLSYVYFSLIRNTVAVYQSCFPPAMMSSCVKWAKENVDSFNQTFAQQMKGEDKKGETYRDCLERAKFHAQVLQDVGLDFKNLVGNPPQSEPTPGHRSVPSVPSLPISGPPKTLPPAPALPAHKRSATASSNKSGGTRE